ncbi:MAG: type II secretion system F family protein [Actinomycetota bacterium]|nr:type II secretion system F family protein [Actinomycetota bacterium]
MTGLGAAAAAAAAVWCLLDGWVPGGRRLSRLDLGAAAPRGSGDDPGWAGGRLSSGGLVAALAGGAGVVTAAAAGLLAGLLAAAGVVAAARRRASVDQLRQQEHQRRTALDLCAVLAAELRAGSGPVDALTAAADAVDGRCSELARRAASAARVGGDAGLALRSMPDRQEQPVGRRRADPVVEPAALVLRRLAACWQVSARTGAGLATSVDRLAEALRVDEEQRAELAAQLAGPRATARLLAALPLAGVGMAALLGAAPMAVLLHTRWGAGCLLLGLGLDVAGVAWTGRLTREALAR